MTTDQWATDQALGLTGHTLGHPKQSGKVIKKLIETAKTRGLKDSTRMAIWAAAYHANRGDASLAYRIMQDAKEVVG